MRIPIWLADPCLRLAVKLPLRFVGTPQALRRRFERNAAHAFAVPHGARFGIETLARSGGAPIRALRCTLGACDPGGAILYLHGGAYLAGSPETHRHLGAALAGAAGLPAILPDYRLAPEHPFPAAVEDALDAYRALLARGLAPERIAIAGDSAGGGLAAALVIAAAGAGLPSPGCLCLFSPWADLTMSAPSLTRNAARDAMLPVGRMREVIRHYLQGADPADPRASPARARFRAPPPALILASRAEILADDAAVLADALRAGGGDVRLELWPGMPHAWPVFAGRLAAADRAVAFAGRFIARHARGAEARPA